MERKRLEKLLVRAQEIEHDICELRRVRMEIATSGTASASLSSGGGSKSYTRLDLTDISALLAELVRELKEIRRMLGGGGPFGISFVQFARC